MIVPVLDSESGSPPGYWGVAIVDVGDECRDLESTRRTFCIWKGGNMISPGRLQGQGQIEARDSEPEGGIL